jgi:multiple antibiotic resistance protein
LGKTRTQNRHVNAPVIKHPTKHSPQGEKDLIENFITTFIVYFVVIDPIGTAPIFLAITTHLNKRQKIRTAREDTFVAGAIMLFFALCGVWILHYLNISLTAFRLAGGVILLLMALDMLANKRQTRREQGHDTISTDGNIAIFPLATPLLAGPAAFGASSGLIFNAAIRQVIFNRFCAANS